MIDKYTYGNTPAAIYLTEVLNSVGSSKMIRKVTRTLTDFNEIINELEAANKNGLLSAHTLGALGADLRARAQRSTVGEHELVKNLLQNMMVGRVKELTRRVRVVRLIEKQRAGMVVDKDEIEPICVADITDTITPKTLVAKSKRKLTRLNKVDTLY